MCQIAKKCHVRIAVLLIAALLFAVLLSTCSPTESIKNSKPQAFQGKLDLQEWDFAEDGIVSLNGEWSFYWEQLLSPQDFILMESSHNSPSTEWLKLPGSWNGYLYEDKKVDGMGFATFRLLIETDGNDHQLGLRIGTVSTAYKLWVNGELLSSIGIVGNNREAMSPQYIPSTVYFNSNEEIIEIVVQASNFMHRRGGLRGNIELGTSQDISQRATHSFALEMFIVGSLMIMSIYHFGLFALRRSDRSPLYFGLFCLFIGIRSLLVGEYYWYQLFPNFSWEINMSMEYLLIYLSLPVFVIYIQNLYPKQSSELISKLLLVIVFFYCSIILTTSASVFTNTLFSYHIITLVIIVYLIYVLSLAVVHKEKGAVLISFGIIFYALTIVNDILYYNELVGTGDKSTVGLFVFVFAQSFVLSMKFSKAYSDVEILSRQLQELNISLEEKVAERTQSLVEFNQFLASANEELFRMEKSRRRLISNISHDLRTPMTSIQGYIEAILDGVIDNPLEQHKHLQLIHSKSLGIIRLINDLFQLSQLEAGQTSFSFQTTEIRQLVEDITSKYEMDVTSTGLKYFTQSQFNSSPLAPTVNIDPDRIDQVISNILFNAIRHTPIGGSITVSFETLTPFELLIKIIDTGNGITEEKLPFIFDRFYKESDVRNTSAGGSGLGLAISKEIILSHGGDIWAESTPGKGSTFCFTLPLQGM